MSSSYTVQQNVLQLVLLTAIFFAPFYLGHWKDNPPVIDELFDTFAVDNYIKKYCRGKQ